MLIGMLFVNPLLGAAVSASAGALSAAFTGRGLDDKSMKELAETFKPGCSAIFVLLKKAIPDKVLEALEPFEGKGKVLKTSFFKTKRRACARSLRLNTLAHLIDKRLSGNAARNRLYRWAERLACLGADLPVWRPGTPWPGLNVRRFSLFTQRESNWERRQVGTLRYA